MAFQDASLPGKGLKVPAIFSNYQRKEEPLIPKSDKLKNGLKSKTNKLLDACVIESFAHHPVPYFSFKLNSEEMPPPRTPAGKPLQAEANRMHMQTC